MFWRWFFFCSPAERRSEEKISADRFVEGTKDTRKDTVRSRGERSYQKKNNKRKMVFGRLRRDGPTTFAVRLKNKRYWKRQIFLYLIFFFLKIRHLMPPLPVLLFFLRRCPGGPTNQRPSRKTIRQNEVKKIKNK